MTGRGFFLLLAFAGALYAPVFAAEAPRQIAWDDLTVKLTSAENPFAGLPPEQLEALADVAGLRDRKARGVTLTAAEIATEREASERLRKAGVDVDGLLSRRQEVMGKLREAAGKVNSSLDGKLVRLPGYVLPLEFSGKQVTEFLLVPWIGACIHTPPPPPNQIVHVKPDKPIEVAGTFDAVWVTGRMAASGSRRSVFLIDGTADIDVGYALQATKVEPYAK